MGRSKVIVKTKPHFDFPNQPNSGLYKIEATIPIMVEYMSQIKIESTSDPSVELTIEFTLDEWYDLFNAIDAERRKHKPYTSYSEEVK